jgi:hypothetical protein
MTEDAALEDEERKTLLAFCNSLHINSQRREWCRYSGGNLENGKRRDVGDPPLRIELLHCGEERAICGTADRFFLRYGRYIYPPAHRSEDKTTYSGRLIVSGNSLKLRGCATRVLCKTQTWTRLN